MCHTVIHSVTARFFSPSVQGAWNELQVSRAGGTDALSYFKSQTKTLKARDGKFHYKSVFVVKCTEACQSKVHSGKMLNNSRKDFFSFFLYSVFILKVKFLICQLITVTVRVTAVELWLKSQCSSNEWMKGQMNESRNERYVDTRTRSSGNLDREHLQNHRENETRQNLLKRYTLRHWDTFRYINIHNCVYLYIHIILYFFKLFFTCVALVVMTFGLLLQSKENI